MDFYIWLWGNITNPPEYLSFLAHILYIGRDIIIIFMSEIIRRKYERSITIIAIDIKI